MGLLAQISPGIQLPQLVPQRRDHEQRNAWELKSFIPSPSDHSPEQEPGVLLTLHTPQVGFGQGLVRSVSPHCDGTPYCVPVHGPQSAPAF